MVYPRLYCLGLIEAIIFLMSAGDPKTYPRLYCLGLIEARNRKTARRPAKACIRGFIASASLKHLDWRGDRAAWVRIRGFIASASLKRLDVMP